MEKAGQTMMRRSLSMKEEVKTKSRKGGFLKNESRRTKRVSQNRKYLPQRTS
jgi:hypothetical protein